MFLIHEDKKSRFSLGILSLVRTWKTASGRPCPNESPCMTVDKSKSGSRSPYGRRTRTSWITPWLTSSSILSSGGDVAAMPTWRLSESGKHRVTLKLGVFPKIQVWLWKSSRSLPKPGNQSSSGRINWNPRWLQAALSPQSTPSMFVRKNSQPKDSWRLSTLKDGSARRV